MDEVFVYWDNSNIFHEAQRLADEEVPGRALILLQDVARRSTMNRPYSEGATLTTRLNARCPFIPDGRLSFR